MAEALALLNGDDSGDVAALAGGQSLMPMLNLRLATPDALVDLNGIEGLAGLEDEGEHIRIGALTRHVDIETSKIAAKHLPLFVRAVGEIAHAAIRHRGTLGGSLALADPAAEFPACCVACGAVIVTQSLTGERRIAAEDFFHGIFHTELEHGELITAVEIPKHGGRAEHWGFDEIARRKGDYATAGLVVFGTGKRALDDPRIVLFGVGEKPLRVNAAEAVIAGCRLPVSDEVIAEAQEAMGGLELIEDLHSSTATKAHLAKVLLGRVLKTLS